MRLLHSQKIAEITLYSTYRISTLIVIILLSGVMIISSCGKSVQPRKQQSILDTGAHHTIRGQDLISRNRWSSAEKQFDLALELNPEYSPALSAKAIVKAFESTREGRTPERVEALRTESRSLLETSLNTASGEQELTRSRINTIRAESLLQDEGWVETTEKHYRESLELIENHPALRKMLPELHFFMGNAYLKARSFSKASTQYRHVLELNQGYTREANTQQMLLQKIVRAQPGTLHGKTVALSNEITRADLAALLIEEFHLEDLYKRGTSGDTSAKKFPSPIKKMGAAQPISTLPASDISKHPLREEIELILQLKVRGLEVNPQHLFFPNRPVTRAEYALMLEDILIRVTQESGLSTSFIGEKSPWQDVRADAYYYNAARVLTSRGIIQVRNQIRGEFGPEDPIHGADILLSLRLLKDELKSYVHGS